MIVLLSKHIESLGLPVNSRLVFRRLAIHALSNLNKRISDRAGNGVALSTMTPGESMTT